MKKEFIYGFFARVDHPKGWGMADTRAHGYVVIVVKCWNPEELGNVRELLAREFKGIGEESSGYSTGHLSNWYGGNFDFLFSITSNSPPTHQQGDVVKYHSVGDNRFYGMYDASKLLKTGQLASARIEDVEDKLDAAISDRLEKNLENQEDLKF